MNILYIKTGQGRLTKALKLHQKANVIVIDIEDIEKMDDFEEDTFDVVFANDVLHLCNLQRVIDEIKAVTKIGGWIFVSYPLWMIDIQELIDAFNLPVMFEGTIIHHKENYHHLAVQNIKEMKLYD